MICERILVVWVRYFTFFFFYTFCGPPRYPLFPPTRLSPVKSNRGIFKKKNTRVFVFSQKKKKKKKKNRKKKKKCCFFINGGVIKKKIFFCLYKFKYIKAPCGGGGALTPPLPKAMPQLRGVLLLSPQPSSLPPSKSPAFGALWLRCSERGRDPGGEPDRCPSNNIGAMSSAVRVNPSTSPPSTLLWIGRDKVEREGRWPIAKKVGDVLRGSFAA